MHKQKLKSFVHYRRITDCIVCTYACMRLYYLMELSLLHWFNSMGSSAINTKNICNNNFSRFKWSWRCCLSMRNILWPCRWFETVRLCHCNGQILVLAPVYSAFFQSILGALLLHLFEFPVLCGSLFLIHHIVPFVPVAHPRRDLSIFVQTIWKFCKRFICIIFFRARSIVRSNEQKIDSFIQSKRAIINR